MNREREIERHKLQRGLDDVTAYRVAQRGEMVREALKRAHAVRSVNFLK